MFDELNALMDLKNNDTSRARRRLAAFTDEELERLEEQAQALVYLCRSETELRNELKYLDDIGEL